MKRQFVNRIARKFFAGSMVAAVLFLSVQTKAAVNADPINKSKSASIEYVGSKDDNLLFKVNYINNSNDFYTVTVTDENGEVLYRHATKQKDFSKTFQLTRYTDINKLSFSIETAKENYKESFDINTTTTTTSHVAVVMN